MTAMHVLVLDDEPVLREILADIVTKAGFSVDVAASVKEAAAKLARGDVDVALCDIKLPDGNGIDLVRQSVASGIDTAFVMVTAFGSMETAVEALRAGASDYIVKPVRSAEVIHRLTQIAAMRGLREENQALRKAANPTSSGIFAWESAAMLELDRLVARVAPTDATVLVTGESGTGKGVIAQVIHDRSTRHASPFVVINCSAIPEHLLESEFFGHTKGAFTSADKARKGLFLQADGGTVFLDEIAELPLQMQTKLLHVIEDKIVRPVGSETARRVDMRIVAATNRNLQEMVSAGSFREDLFFRLSMFNIRMPPLRERKSDIPKLIEHLLRRAVAERRGRVTLDAGVAEVLVNYPWPGNVRQLDNVIRRAVILAMDDFITLNDLPHEIVEVMVPRVQPGEAGAAGAQSGRLRDQVRRYEAEIVQREIQETGGDRRLAAQRLGIALSSLYKKLEGTE